MRNLCFLVKIQGKKATCNNLVMSLVCLESRCLFYVLIFHVSRWTYVSGGVPHMKSFKIFRSLSFLIFLKEKN